MCKTNENIWEERFMDIFETLIKRCGCEYISDLTSERFRGRAISELKKINIKRYTINELNDVIRYLYGVKAIFTSYEEMDNFIINN